MKAQTRHRNKTVIYFWLKTKIIWTAHYKGNVKIFSPRLSDHFHTVHLACTQESPSNERTETNTLNKRQHKPISKRKREEKTTKKIKNPSSNKKKTKNKNNDCTVTKYFGLVLGHAVGRWVAWRQQRRRHKRCENQLRSSLKGSTFPPFSRFCNRIKLAGWGFSCVGGLQGESKWLLTTIKSAVRWNLSSTCEILTAFRRKLKTAHFLTTGLCTDAFPPSLPSPIFVPDHPHSGPTPSLPTPHYVPFHFQKSFNNHLQTYKKQKKCAR